MATLQLSQLDTKKQYSFADYLSWQFEERVELIKGILHRMSPAPNVAHQRITTALTALFWQHFRNQVCQVFTAPFDVKLSDGARSEVGATVVQPDMCVVCDPHKLDQHGCNGAPDLIVEVLSPGNTKREMRDKFAIYQTAGVREYWIVSPHDKTILVYVLNDEGQYIGLPPYTDEQHIEPTIFPELDINMGELWL